MAVRMWLTNGYPGFLGLTIYKPVQTKGRLAATRQDVQWKEKRQKIQWKQKRRNIESEEIGQEIQRDGPWQNIQYEESRQEIQRRERERICADLHDELGSGISAIRLLSEVARNKMKDNLPVEIEKISNSAKELLNKIDCIIWSMNMGNDTLDNLVTYIRSYAMDYFDSTPIQCKVNEPESVYEKPVEGIKRRNIFLCIKETLNNAWKHSGCTVITIDIDAEEELFIRIADNGKGIDPGSMRHAGNGLKNMANRMESIGGRFSIENGQGTITVLQLPL